MESGGEAELVFWITILGGEFNVDTLIIESDSVSEEELVRPACGALI